MIDASTTHEEYDIYNETDEIWVGRLPKQWKLKPVKYLCRFVSGSTPSKDNKQYWIDGDMPWVSPKDMKVPFLTDTQDHLTDRALKDTTLQIVEPGALLIVVRSGILQRTIPVAINRVRVTVNQDMRALVFQSLDEARYFSYLVQGHTDALLQIWTKEGATVESIEYEFIANSSVPVPPHDEQRQIAGFLDYETAKIDALIEKQQQLIALLGEKRQAVISHAVTKGLNPDAPMRDSGVEWLGEIPKHWKATRLKFLLSQVVDCHHSTPHYDDEAPWPALRTSDISAGILDVENARRVHDDEYMDRISRLKPQAGDVIYAREGGRWGVAAPIPEGADVCLAQRVMLLRGNKRMLSQFVMWSLNSRPVYHQLAVNVVGSASPHVNIVDVLEVWLAEPPINEQPDIVAGMERQLSKLDSLDKQCVNVIETLQERRTALISAAVTGKIDVRGWKPPSSAA